MNITINTTIANDEATRLNSSNLQNDTNKEENKDSEKKEDECFITDEERNLYLDLIDLKDSVPEILLIPQKKTDKTQVKNEVQEEALAEQQPQIKVLNTNQENTQNLECYIYIYIYI